MNRNFEIVQKFAFALDADDFDSARFCLSENALYEIGKTTWSGPVEICNSYETNMLEGKAKLDELKWGKSRVEEVSENCFIIHFTDYLTHNKLSHIHRCEQKVWLNTQSRIIKIQHLQNTKEEYALKEFYKKVDLD